jgi:LDH2 family malate/lactate/ureidoglycolate dehydrogenase
MEAEYIRVERKCLETFCEHVFRHLHLSENDARMTATVIVMFLPKLFRLHI